MDMRKPCGQYRTKPREDRTPMAYVMGGGAPSYITETAYRAKGYKPDFAELPTEAEYDCQRS
jgi:hypothetical protein